MDVTEHINEHGIWFDIEEQSIDCQEGQFKPNGFYLNGSLLFTWKRSDEYRKGIKNNND